MQEHNCKFGGAVQTIFGGPGKRGGSKDSTPGIIWKVKLHKLVLTGLGVNNTVSLQLIVVKKKCLKLCLFFVIFFYSNTCL